MYREKRLNIVVMTLFAIVCCSLRLQAQDKQSINGYLVPMCIYNGDTIPCVQLRTVYISVRWNSKWKGTSGILPTDSQCEKVYPISREINQAIIETYEYLQTLPNEKARQKHIKRVEKGLKDQYTPRMKNYRLHRGNCWLN